MDSVILCRYGELFLKSGNRRRFERALADNMRAALADMPARASSSTHGRVLVRLPEAEADDAAARLQRVFGLVSLSIARQVDADGGLEAIESRPPSTRRARRSRATAPRRSRSKRAAPTSASPSTSMEIARHVGARVQATGPGRRRPHARAAPGHRGGHRPSRSSTRARGRARAGCRSAPRAARCCCCRAASIRRSPAGWPPSAAWRSTPSTFTRRPTSARSRATRC